MTVPVCLCTCTFRAELAQDDKYQNLRISQGGSQEADSQALQIALLSPHGFTQLRLLWGCIGNQLQPQQSHNITIPQTQKGTSSLVNNTSIFPVKWFFAFHPYLLTSGRCKTARFCPPICWLSNGENCQNQREKQYSVLHDHAAGTRSTHQYGTSYSRLLLCAEWCFHHS